MSRFLIATIPVLGHVLPMMPIAEALIARGHEVSWYTGAFFQDKITDIGAQFLPIKEGLDYSVIENVPPELTAKRNTLKGLNQLKFDIEHFFIKAGIGYTKDLLVELQTFNTDVILADSFFLAASWVSEKIGIPWAQLGISVLTLPSQDTAPFGLGLKPMNSPLGRLRNKILYGLLKSVVFRSLYTKVNEARAELSLGPTNLLLDNLSPYLYLSGTVPSFEYPRTDLPPQVKFIGPLLPKIMSDFSLPKWWSELKDERPVIHVTQGTFANNPKSLIIPTIEALKDEPVLVVATLGKQPTETWKSISLPDNVRVEPLIPYHLLFPHVNVAVTNGGYNGVQMALANGIPLVGAGKSEDKLEVCTRIEWSGAGVNLKTNSPTPSQIKKAVKLTLSKPQYRRQAQKIQSEIQGMKPAETAAEYLEELASRHF